MIFLLTFNYVAMTYILITQTVLSEELPESMNTDVLQTCGPTTHCITLRNCPIVRNEGYRQASQKICGYTTRGKRRPMVCCPRTDLTEIPAVTERDPNGVHGHTPSSSINTSGCGIPRNSYQSGFVMGGSKSKPGAWPWMVAVTKKDKYGNQSPWCTGFLVSERHVISAAHCFDNPQKRIYEARIGDVDLREGEIYAIRSIKNHEKFKEGFYYDDISLLTLARPVTNPRVNIICLPDNRLGRRNLTGLGTTVAGWGSQRSGGPLSNELRHLGGMKVIANSVCDRNFKTRIRNFEDSFPEGITSRFLCAGYVEGGRDACGGDSGGPLMFLQRGKWYAVGIVTFGTGCGIPGFSGGYTKVASYMDWIREHMQA